MLLLAGAGLILLEGPVGSPFLHRMLVPEAVEKQTPKAVGNPSVADTRAASAKPPKPPSAPKPTWAATLDDASPLHSTILGEIPLNEKSDPATASK